ncbi:response regulator [Massilia glaciei]|uniref:Response regulator n=1 Tax=Massilia glaciei TaxID=1524097 RepID=A0A2U2HLY6_9BURK|nr:response regulator [Massilia glaciei]PWF48531.1 response regulator [Massilia glaciei]
MRGAKHRAPREQGNKMTTDLNQRQHGTRPPAAPPPVRKYLVLSVEDDPSDSALISELVSRRADLTLLSATHGGAAVKLARAHRPALNLMDINLPGLSGIDALGFLRDDPNTAGIPVIGLSSDRFDCAVDMCLSGFFGYLSKPFKLDDFECMVDAALVQSARGPTRAN